MKTVSTVLGLSLLAAPASFAAAEEATAEFLLFHHICITGYSVTACSCAFPLLAHHVPGDRLNGELKAHGGEFFARSPLASFVKGMLQICAPTRPNIGAEARD
jgi:hypothetical protein